MRRAKLFWGLAALVTLLLVLTAWVLSCQKIGAPGAGMRARFIVIESKVSISHLPKLYEPFTVTGKFTPVRDDIPDAELWLEGGIYLDGEAYWHGPLKKGETKTLSARFFFLTEGHTGVGAYGSSRPGSLEYQPFFVYVSKEFGQRGWWPITPTPRPGVFPGIIYPWGPFYVPTSTVLTDTSLLLNTSGGPRVEFAQSWEEVQRLQNQGLLPKELRYEWNWMHPSRIDFSKVFLIIFWDGMKPAPGHLVDFPGAYFVFDGSVLKGDFATYSLPPEIPVPSRPVSAVVVLEVSYETLGRPEPDGRLAPLDIKGPRIFELTLNGKPFKTVSMDLVPATPQPAQK